MTTFKQQSEDFLVKIQSRRREPVKASTLVAYRSRLNAHILPELGALELSQIENGTLRTFVETLTKKGVSASAINGVIGLVKEVVASARDNVSGVRLYPRIWDNEFIDAPAVNPKSQSTPVATPEGVQRAVSRALGQEKALYALLAGTGLRIGEALALMVGLDDGINSFWVPESGILHIRTTLNINNGKIGSPKTLAGNRQVDLNPRLNTFLCQLLLDGDLPRCGLLFRNAYGSGPVRFNTLREHAVELGIDPRFHAFRRFRITHMDSVGVPPGLQRFWSGHAASDVHENYIRMGEKIEERKAWAQKAGLGFQLEA